MEVVRSKVESDRFGCAIGRATMASVPSAFEVHEACAGFDVVVVRASTILDQLPAALARVDGWTAFTADHLLYWRWDPERFDAAATRPGSVTETTTADGLDTLVRSVFDGYGNHYVANPILDSARVVDGYVEWVEHLVRNGSATCFVSSDGHDSTGFAVVDWSVDDLPDVRLAGVAPDHRGRGSYAGLLSQCMSAALDRGRDGLQISTQSRNVQVMRSWARLGLIPFESLATLHLVRDQLL